MNVLKEDSPSMLKVLAFPTSVHLLFVLNATHKIFVSNVYLLLSFFNRDASVLVDLSQLLSLNVVQNPKDKKVFTSLLLEK